MDLAAFEALAGEFARGLRPGDVVALEGELGAGKTTFVAAVVRALHGSDEVASPTFTFWHRYAGQPPLEHLDLYRIDNPAEADGTRLARGVRRAQRHLRRVARAPARACPARGDPRAHRGCGRRPARRPDRPPRLVSWLGLDGALGAFSAALVPRRGAPRAAAADGNDALERGLAIVDAVLGGTRLDELAGIAVGTGPGSFTGLRIALSYAKSLAFASGRPLAGISSYDALTPGDATPPHAVFVHGRAGIACVRLARLRRRTRRCGTYAALAEAVASRVTPGTVLDSYGAAEGVAPALGERGVIVRVLASDRELPALAIARRAAALRTFGVGSRVARRLRRSALRRARRHGLRRSAARP